MSEKQRIIIIEDDVLLRNSMVSIINQSSRYAVVGEYDNLQDSFRRIREFQNLIILLDVHLYGKRTTSEVNSVKRLNPYNKVIMLSSDSTKETIVESLKNGADGYLVKEDATVSLGTYLDQCMRFDYVLSPSASESVCYLLQSAIFDVSTASNAEAKDSLKSLTQAQKLVYRELIKGKSYQVIADALGISKNTVGQHVQAIYKTLGIHSRVELLATKQSM